MYAIRSYYEMKVEVEAFNVIIEADVTEEHPKHYNKMKVIYQFKGKDLPYDKLERAVKLSEEKYCGVTAVYRKAIRITSYNVCYTKLLRRCRPVQWRQVHLDASVHRHARQTESNCSFLR